MTVRSCVLSDLTDAPVPWLVPDPGADGGACLVEAVGGRIIQAVPAAYFPSAHPEVQAWAEDQLVRSSNDVCLEAGDRYSLDDLLDMWMAAYVRMHEDWAPTGDVEATRQAFAGRFAHDLDLHRSTISLIEARPTAAVFTIGPLDGILMPVLIEIDPRHPGRELAARAAIATMLVRAAPHTRRVRRPRRRTHLHADPAGHSAAVQRQAHTHEPRRDQ